MSVPVTFPTSGRYRIVVDAYPKVAGPSTPFNFQLFKWVTVGGKYHPKPVPPYRSSEVVDGYRFTVQGHPHLKAIQPAFFVVHVTDPAGRKAVFTNWRGALAHAIFFHQGSLAYSHTHVCKPNAIYCFSALGNVRVTGHSTAPGILKIGVLLPEAGIWRMFLLTYQHGHVRHRPIHPPRDVMRAPPSLAGAPGLLRGSRLRRRRRGHRDRRPANRPRRLRMRLVSEAGRGSCGAAGCSHRSRARSRPGA